MGGIPEAKGKAQVQVEDSPFPLTETDIWVLSQTDEEFHLHDWDELRQIIGESSNSLLLQRAQDL